MATDKFSLLKKILKAIGLSDERIDELISWVRTWLLDDSEKKTGEIKFPYRLRDDFLSPAERNFMRVLRAATSEWAMIAPKVSLGDLFYPQTSDGSQYLVSRNKIDRKHVDFLLYDPQTLRPLLGIELDDKSHQRKDHQERDCFKNGVFSATGLPLARVPVRHSYQVFKLNQFLQKKAGLSPDEVDSEAQSTTDVIVAVDEPICPKCGTKMVLRTATRGSNKGNQFWGCTDYPRCKGIRPYVASSQS